MKKYLVLISIINFSLFIIENDVHGQTAKLPKAKHIPIVIAHRGNHEHAPENTLQSLKDAIKIGADYVEIDLRTTLDSQLVIMHDGNTKRMTGVEGLIKNITYDSLTHLQVRDINHPEWGFYKIPRLEDILSVAEGKINIYLDFKDASVEAAYQVFKKFDMQHHVCVYINSVKQLREWRQLHPEVPLIVSWLKSMSFDEFVQFANPDIMDGSVGDYSVSQVQKMLSMKKHIWLDVQSSNEGVATWDRALKLEVSGMQTDKPEELIAYLKSKGLRK